MRTIGFLVLASTFLVAGAGASRADRVVLVAGGGTGGDGPAVQARLDGPFAVGFDGVGTLFFVEMTGNRIKKVSADGVLTTIAGTGQKGDAGDGGPAAQAQFNGMHHLIVRDNGDLLVADTWNNRVRAIDAASGRITAFAGTGRKGFSGDGGPAAQADFGGIYCLALDEGRHALYLDDLDNRRIRMVDLKSAVATTVAGNGKKGVPEDGTDARSAPLVDPRAVAVDGQGNIYVLERSGNALRVVDRAGKVRTVSGFVGKFKLNGPKHLCVAPNGDVLIADTENHRILKYRPHDGTIATLAGTGHKGVAGIGGPPEAVELNLPHGVFVGPGGVVYIADSGNQRILKLVH